jgi:pimeloyl-ACP methyl ester carboxylesterase
MFAILLIGSVLLLALLFFSVSLFKQPIKTIQELQGFLLKIQGFRPRRFKAQSGQTTYFEAGKGAPIVLLHGFMVNAGNWLDLAPHLKKYGRVLLPNLPGHGDSPVATPNTLEQINAIIADFLLDVSQNEPLTLIGNSMGGGIALRFALDHPERVKRLIVLDSAGIRWELDRAMLLPETRADVRRKMEAILNPRFHFPNLVLDALLQQNKPVYQCLFDDAVSNEKYFMDAELPYLKVKTYLIWGEKDGLFPMPYCHKLCSLLPDYELVTFPTAAHVPHNTHARAVLKQLDKWLD